MTRPFALFDVDCQELNDAGDGLSLRPRVEPLAPQIARLYDLADRADCPVVFTTCCSGRMLAPRDVPGVVFVPLAGDGAADWQSQLDARRFYLQKKTYHDPQLNYACQAFDMFADNGNAARLVRALNAEQWIVFGNGFDLCVNAAATGLLDAGSNVLLVTDVAVPTATGYGRCGTPENRDRILAALQARGARLVELADLEVECVC